MNETKLKKQPKNPTAKKIKDLNIFAGEVALFELSKQIKKGTTGSNFIVIAKIKPRNGLKNILMWMSDKDAGISSDPIKELIAVSIEDGLLQLGYKLI